MGRKGGRLVIMLALVTTVLIALPFAFISNLSELTSGTPLPHGSPVGVSDEKADYVIYKENGDTVAAYGQNNSEIIRSTDASAVFQHVIDLTPGNNKTIYVEKGTYEVRSLVVKDKHGLTIYGDGNSTILKHPNAAPDAIIFIGLHLTTKLGQYDITIRDLVLNGDYPEVAQGAGIDISGSKNVLIKNVVFMNFGQRALRACTWDENQTASYGINVENCFFESSDVVLGGIDGGHIKDSIFEGTSPGNTIVDVSYGEHKSAWLRDFWFESDIFKNVNGSKMEGGLAGFQYVQGGGINNCRFENLNISSTIVTFGFQQSYYFKDYLISNNIFTNSPGLILQYGANITLVNNTMDSKAIILLNNNYAS